MKAFSLPNFYKSRLKFMRPPLWQPAAQAGAEMVSAASLKAGLDLDGLWNSARKKIIKAIKRLEASCLLAPDFYKSHNTHR